MSIVRRSRFTFLKRLQLTTISIGLIAGLVFPPIAAPLVGDAAFEWPFMLGCLVMGLTVGTSLYLTVKASLLRQLRQHLALLRPLSGETRIIDDTMEGLEAGLNKTVTEIHLLLASLIAAVEEFVPHYQTLATASGYLSERTGEGLTAAVAARRHIEEVEEKQQQIAAQMERLSQRAESESALSQQFSASLEEMASAIESSNARFLDTTSAVDEMAVSIRQVGSEAEAISRAVEQTARDLGGIGESMACIGSETHAGVDAVEAVKADAEIGLQVVDGSIAEMEKISDESRKAVEAMGRLAHQAEEVGKIIGVIRELVSDTELLAFNAAIIAAQAGAEGRGFSVVAEEIRDLADRTTVSAKDIEQVVKMIATDAEMASRTVEATGQRIDQGKRRSESAGEALRKIVASADKAVVASGEVARVTAEEGKRAHALLEEAGRSLSSVRLIASALKEQQTAVNRIQHGVSDMKEASDRIARGMEEQLRAKRDLDRGLEERGGQIQAINDAVCFQMAVARKVFGHFAASEARLGGNAERAEVITREIGELESLAGDLRELADRFGGLRRERPDTRTEKVSTGT